MKWLDRLAVWALLTIGLCACTFTRDKKDDEHLAVHEHQEQKLDRQSNEVKQSGPETITTTVEEYEVESAGIEPALPANVAPEMDQPGIGPSASTKPPRNQATAAHVLVKRTVTVDQRGPVVDTKTVQAQETGCEDLGLDMTRHTETTSKTSPALAGYLWMALAAAAVAGAGWLAWKFSLPGKLLALIR